jgi:hypothetical protein
MGALKKNEGLIVFHGIYFPEDGLGSMDDFLNDLFHSFYSVDKTLWSLGSNFFPYSLHQFLSFCNGSLNDFFASRYIFYQTNGLAHGQNSIF